MTAFWHYILLSEIAQKVLDTDYSWAQRDADRHEEYEALRRNYRARMPDDTGDLSERLLRQVDRLAARVVPGDPGAATKELFTTDIPQLEQGVSRYLRHKKEVWLLIDNLDKGWPTRGATPEDVLIIRTLLDATRKLQRQLGKLGVEFYCLVFLRNDIYELLVRHTSDRDKDTAVTVDWDDAEGFKEVVRQRIMAGTGLSGSFEEMWSAAFEQHIGTQDAFRYLVDRTLMRPRDVLRFLRRSVDVAVNRGHSLVRSEDFITAEATYSEELLLSINYEVSDVKKEYVDLLYHFIGSPWSISRDEVMAKLSSAVGKDKAEDALQLLLWFGFLGISEPGREDPHYSYQVRYNLAKLMAIMNNRVDSQIVIHPAFRHALGSDSSSSRLPM